ncbi:hypothetical protein E2986_08937 [Frieseomelitta varia]|uniref:Uncharacterized protein n=1 Tax=Frieseomelitta varia TaxID=561572 RepID=A0A833W793_9HYME|nr:uncharacterized protein LOC122530418 [Frieseomelitta varia]KAF3426117.1 hypothetical protein E2986_08937 [Frieseomelitta varia]
MGVKEGTVRKMIGDGLSVNLRSNEQILEITGDGCDISVSRNRGSVKVVGDGCRLRIDQNMGDVEYTGDGGQVLLGPKSVRDKVKYHGDGGRIRFDVELRLRNRKSGGGSSKAGEAGRKLDEEEKGKDAPEGERNEGERKQKRKEKRGEADSKGERLARAKIVTTLEYDEKVVKKWFISQGAATVKTIDGASFVKIVPKQTKTKVEVK